MVYLVDVLCMANSLMPDGDPKPSEGGGDDGDDDGDEGSTGK